MDKICDSNQFDSKLASCISEQIAEKLSSPDFLRAVAGGLFLDGYPLLIDPLYYLNKEAAQESADFIKEHLGTAVLFRGHYSPDRFWSYSLGLAKNEGLFLEFGVFSGTSINFFADRRHDVVFHGFDSFEGLPDDWNGWVAERGRFKKTELPQVRENVELHVGWFDKTIPPFAINHANEKISFLHIDCDLYESTKTVFDLLGDRIVQGTVIVFDEFLNYPAWKLHEYKAFTEFCLDRQVKCSFRAFYGQKCTVQIESIA